MPLGGAVLPLSGCSLSSCWTIPREEAETTIPATYSKCLISVLKLARAAWWMLFLVIKSSFSSASVSSVKFTFPSKLKSKACRTTRCWSRAFLLCKSLKTFVHEGRINWGGLEKIFAC